MAIDDNSVAAENKIEENNNTDSEVRVRVARVSDPSNGKSCHQCRQKKKEFAPSCKNLRKGKSCTLKFCTRCLLNRYGQNSEEVAKLGDWNCPKCFGVCNCSCCMKAKGLQPTGSLIHKVKATGCNSVHELLQRPEGFEHQNVETKKGCKRLKLKDYGGCKEDIVPPLGRPLREVAGIELPAQDIGAALQFLEFCNAFSEVLDIQIGRPESILQDLFRGCVEHHEVHSALVEFNIKLLSLVEDIEKDGDAWPIKLRRCIEESQCTLDELPMDFLDRVSSGYENLEPSDKLKLLIFLCDEVLGTEKMRGWIADAAAKFDDERKKNKEKVAAARQKEKLLHQMVKDEKGKAVLSATGGTSMCETEFDDAHLLQLEIEADSAQTEALVSSELVLKKNQRSDAMRTDSYMLGSNGQRLWKLGGDYSTPKIILQDIESWDSVTLQDTWSVFNEEEEKLVEEHISSLRNTKCRRPRTYDVEEGIESDSSHSPGPKDCIPQDQAETSGIAADKEAQQVEDAFDVAHANSGI